MKGTADRPGAPRCRQPIVAGATPDERDPANWPPEALAEIQRVLDRSRAKAGQAVRDTFARGERRMSALEFVTFWNGSRMKAMATVGKRGGPHIAPVHAEFANGRLRSTIYENAVRRRDLRDNPEVALTTWGPHGAAAIAGIPGVAHEHGHFRLRKRRDAGIAHQRGHVRVSRDRVAVSGEVV